MRYLFLPWAFFFMKGWEETHCSTVLCFVLAQDKTGLGLRKDKNEY